MIRQHSRQRGIELSKSLTPQNNTQKPSVPFFGGETADEVWRAVANAFADGQPLIQDGRGGSTRELLHAVLAITNPRQRWLPSRRPAMNPAFAIAELVWIMAGRDDAAFVNFFNPALPNYAGRSGRYHGAYGYRLRRAFGLDQLMRAKTALEANPESRQVVLQIWDTELDLPKKDGTPKDADIPCNVLGMLKVRQGRLDWTQVLRSNDLFLGVPFNIVQFSSLQEVVAGWLGLEVGQYTQFSDSLHVYERDLSKIRTVSDVGTQPNTDDIALPFVESSRAWSKLERVTDRLVSNDLSRIEFEQLVATSDLPLGFQNYLTILAADAARRRGWIDQMDRVAALCRNAALSQLWRGWLRRVSTAHQIQ